MADQGDAQRVSPFSFFQKYQARGRLGRGSARGNAEPPERKGREAARPCVSKEAKPAKFHSLIENFLRASSKK